MRKMYRIIFTIVMLCCACSVYADVNANVDRVIDPAKSSVGYDIVTSEGQTLALTIDYDSKRPTPEIENMDISPVAPVSEGTKIFKIPTKEGEPIEIEYSYSNGERTGMKISATPSNPSSDAEYSQIVSVVSKLSHVINFTFVWQGQELKEVRIEPLVNPFDVV
jgi:hypothetical protein